MLFIKPLCFLCLFLVFTLKKTPTLLLVYTFTIAVLLPGVVARWGGCIPRTQREREGGQRTENPAEEGKDSGRGPRRGCLFLCAHGLVLGVANSLRLQFQDRAVPTVPTWLLAWPSPSASSSASPPRAGPRLLSPQTTARNEILHSCQDKGRVGRER